MGIVNHTFTVCEEEYCYFQGFLMKSISYKTPWKIREYYSEIIKQNTRKSLSIPQSTEITAVNLVLKVNFQFKPFVLCLLVP